MTAVSPNALQQANYIPNSELDPGQAWRAENVVRGTSMELPGGWVAGSRSAGAPQSRFFLNRDTSGIRSIGIRAGRDLQGVWSVPIAACTPGRSYRFTGEFYRQDTQQGSYPEIHLWGQRMLIDTLIRPGSFLTATLNLSCPAPTSSTDNTFCFVNRYPESIFFLRRPHLAQVQEDSSASSTGSPAIQNFSSFPIGVYGATQETMESIRDSGCNSVIIPADTKLLHHAQSLDLQCLISVPHTTHQLADTLEKLSPFLISGKTGFYVNDEPEIHGFPASKAETINTLLKKQFPALPTFMAIVRPHVISGYAQAADFFLLDQYPIPDMPVIWLADSIDVAAEQVGSHRTMAVVQAFGGGRWREAGWSRRPTAAELSNLAFLALIHGAQGLFFYSYPEIMSDSQALLDFQKTMGRLQRLKRWLPEPNCSSRIPIRYLSPYHTSPSGKPALHCTMKQRQNSQTLLLCANTLTTHIDALITLPDQEDSDWLNPEQETIYSLSQGALFHSFSPLEVLILEKVSKGEG